MTDSRISFLRRAYIDSVTNSSSWPRSVAKVLSKSAFYLTFLPNPQSAARWKQLFVKSALATLAIKRWRQGNNITKVIS